MKFEVGKKYWDVRHNGIPVTYTCVAIHKSAPVFGLDELNLSDIHAIVKYGALCNGRTWVEYKEPAVHTQYVFWWQRDTWDKCLWAQIRDNRGLYAEGRTYDGAKLLKIDTVTYTEEQS